MGRALRVDVADQFYHVLNRANGKQTIFRRDQDYLAFETILMEGIKTFDMRLYAHEIMPNHWHLLVSPRKDGDLARFVGWLTLTHTQRYHAYNGTTGFGHLYQGRYKSFIVESDSYFYRVCRYIERNALRAKLVKRAEKWRWGSAWIRLYGNTKHKAMLSDWPGGEPDGYLMSLNEDDDSDNDKKGLEQIRHAVNRGNPLGGLTWAEKIVTQFKLGVTIQPQGRPRKRR